jgi:hypothetical protein
MKILIEGIPGTKKSLIYHSLRKAHKLEVWRKKKRIDWDIKTQCFQLEVDFMLQSKEEEDQYMIHDSEYSIVHVYSELYHELGYLNQHELEQLHKLGDFLVKEGDVIIYLFGDLETCYQRYLDEIVDDSAELMDQKTFELLYSKYEWVFDTHNCKTKLYKINVEEDLEQVVGSILSILQQIVEFRDRLKASC